MSMITELDLAIRQVDALLTQLQVRSDPTQPKLLAVQESKRGAKGVHVASAIAAVSSEENTV